MGIFYTINRSRPVTKEVLKAYFNKISTEQLLFISFDEWLEENIRAGLIKVYVNPSLRKNTELIE